jgi:hypothetical protein
MPHAVSARSSMQDIIWTYAQAVSRSDLYHAPDSPHHHFFENLEVTVVIGNDRLLGRFQEEAQSADFVASGSHLSVSYFAYFCGVRNKHISVLRFNRGSPWRTVR